MCVCICVILYIEHVISVAAACKLASHVNHMKVGYFEQGAFHCKCSS